MCEYDGTGIGHLDGQLQQPSSQHVIRWSPADSSTALSIGKCEAGCAVVQLAPAPPSIHTCVLVEDVEHPAVAVLGDPIQGAAGDVRVERQHGASLSHQQRLPRGAIPAGQRHELHQGQVAMMTSALTGCSLAATSGLVSNVSQLACPLLSADSFSWVPASGSAQFQDSAASTWGMCGHVLLPGKTHGQASAHVMRLPLMVLADGVASESAPQQPSALLAGASPGSEA
jgi:hypothetical protein